MAPYSTSWSRGGLDETLEDRWPANQAGSPKDVFVNIYVKVNFFVTVYCCKVMITRSDGQSWEDAVKAGGELAEASMNGLSGIDGSVNTQIPSVDELWLGAFGNDFPAGTLIVINPDGGNGNYCGPGTPYDCVYATGPDGMPLSTISSSFGDL